MSQPLQNLEGGLVQLLHSRPLHPMDREALVLAATAGFGDDGMQLLWRLSTHSKDREALGI